MRTHLWLMTAVLLAVLSTACSQFLPGSYAHTTTVNGREVSRVTGSHSYKHSEVHVERNTQMYQACVAEMGEMPQGEEVQECTYDTINQMRIRQQQRQWRSMPMYYSPYYNPGRFYTPPPQPQMGLSPRF